MKKTLTLVEIIIAIVLLAVIVLSASAFDFVSRGFLYSADRKAKVLNEFTYVIDHFSKYIPLATGHMDLNDPNSQGLKVVGTTIIIRADISDGITRAPIGTPDLSDDLWVSYRVNGNNLEFCSNFDKSAGTCNIGWEILTDRFIDLGFSISDPATNSGIVDITNLALRYDPTIAADSRDNPEVTIVDTGGSPTLSFSSSSHSWR
ncbi:MAG: hypothetical protein ABIH08_02610 [Candidatus Omnitrophota bacterium]